jgi:pimeloyl-ACP methyl ester carboxylesterase
MRSPRILLVHGAATTAAVWAPVLELLADLDAVAVERPCSGVLETELASLAPHADGAFVVGVSGGATLTLALAASRVTLAGGIAHEPAVGSLVPGLLGPMAAAFAEGGTPGFARELYGPAWRPEFASPDPDAVARDLPMFRGFEPQSARSGQGAVLVTVGGDSPAPRRAAASALHDRLGYETAVLPGCRHFVQHEQPQVLAALIRARLAEAPLPRSSDSQGT